MNWFDILPYDVAKSQCSWDREAMAMRARECGLTWKEVGRYMGVSRERAYDIALKGERTRRFSDVSPIVRWMNSDSGLISTISGHLIKGDIT